MRICLLFFTLSLLFSACVPENYTFEKEKKGNGAVKIDLRNKLTQRLYDFRDNRQTDSLLHYLNSPDPTLRYLSALSFASWRDSAAIESLTTLLSDPVEEVRIAAAFSMGQIGSPKAEKPLVAAFDSGDSLSQHQRFNAVVLEAIGKCGTVTSLRQIAGVKTYQLTDTLLLEGQCRAILRFGLRKIVDSAATNRMVEYVANERMPRPARLQAAHYLARTEKVAPDSAQAVQLALALVRTRDADIRMPIARALGKSQTQPAFAMLSKVVNTESDWRVKCNIINALAKFDYDTVRALVVPKITDENPHVSRTAAEFFIENGRAKDGDYYWRIANSNPALPWQSRVALYRASNRWLNSRDDPESKDFINFRLRETFQQSANPYERAACMLALGEWGRQYHLIYNQGIKDPSYVVKSAAAEALASIAKRKDFYAVFGESARVVRRELYYYLRNIIATGDPGMIASGADGLRAEALNYNTLRDSARLTDFYTTLQGLKTPRDLEAIEALKKTIAYFEGKPESKLQIPPHDHAIDWALVSSILPATRALIQTKKGDITLVFFPEWAPATVADFMKNANEGKYNGRSFHRVVPGFVVQGGCPRGDGTGAPDYTLRTEIGLAWYDAPGYAGIASIEPRTDTEGVQFFFTQAPTPWLDGGYTIFGKVESGMDVVDKLQVGDLIDRVIIQ
ncbi:MAG: peptidylprolyl isomerase [Saprospiraceae bacterium]